MTSNVSMGTSISSPLHMNRFDQPNQDGLRQRRTLEAFATLLDRLSKAILELQTPTTHSKACIHATDEIKRVYMLLLSLDRSVLKLLLDSFQLEFPKVAAHAVPSTSSARTVLEDEAANDIVEASEEAIECSRAPSPTTSQPVLLHEEPNVTQMAPDDDRDDDNAIVKDFYSPPRLTETETTEASSSDLGDDYEQRDDEGVEVDELRRAITASFDNTDRHVVDNDDEVRDGVPLLSPDDHEADPQPAVRSSNKPKTRKSWFRRRIKNRKSYISAE